MLTKKQEEAYINHPLRCPNCGSEEISTVSPMECDDNYAWQSVECDACESMWVDGYTLTSISEFEKGDK